MQDDEPTHDTDIGMIHGIPAGAAAEEATGVPDSGRQESETVAHPKAGQGK